MSKMFRSVECYCLLHYVWARKLAHRLTRTRTGDPLECQW